jgi:hypothetical protein
VSCTNSSGWTKNITVTNTKNGTFALWELTNDPSSETFITGLVQYFGALSIVFSYTSQQLVLVNSTIIQNVTQQLPVTFTTEESTITINSQTAFLKLRTSSVVFSLNGTESTNKTDSNIIITPDQSSSTITVDFDNYPVQNTAAMTTGEAITAYFGTGLAPGM